ncbi:MAG: glycosyltransferase family 4 protein [Planctomycetota bacterium]|nr:glycosyltransferase family 4 protein [Planctomycetota bacterium]
MVGPLPPTRGGVTTYMLNVMGSFLNERFTFLPFTTSRPPKKNVAANWGYTAILRGGVMRLISGALITLWHVLIFPFVMLIRRPAVVHVMASDYLVFWEATYYVMMARLFRRPALLRVGGGFDVFYADSSPRMKRMIRGALQLPDGVIVLSDYWREMFAELGRTKNLFVIYNAVGEDVLLDAPPRREGRPICLFLAGPEALRKGSREVIAAIALLEKRGIHAEHRLLAIPPVVEEEIHRAGISRAGISQTVRIQGSLDRQEVVREMRQAHIFLLPSHGEGFPNSLLEAMTAHMAAIATRVGAVPEIISDGVGGILIPTGDAEALAQAMATLIQDPQRCEAMGRHNGKSVRERFANSVVLPKLEAVYRQLIEESGR